MSQAKVSGSLFGKSQRYVVLLFLFAAVIAAAMLSSCGEKKVSAASGFPPASVTVTEVTQRSVPLELTAIGNAQPYRAVQLKSMVDGQISKVLLEQGQFVQAGQLLFQLDKRPFRAALDQALGKLAQDKATAAYNVMMAKKDDDLAQQGVIAAQVAQQQESLANSDAAAVQADEAAVETARVNLGYTDIRAPITSRAGAILVNLGNLVKANDTNAITTLNQVEPIYIQFNIPEASLPAVRANGGVGKMKVRAFPPNEPQPSIGKLTFIDNAVDATTGTIKLMATFPNHDHKLWPGEFLNVDLMLGMEQNATVVPAKAVQTGQQGQYVYVVRSDNTAVIQPVVSPRNYQQLAVIQSGLKPGDRVVVDGQIQVIPNAKVNIVKTEPVAPSQSASSPAQQVAENKAGAGGRP